MIAIACNNITRITLQQKNKINCIKYVRGEGGVMNQDAYNVYALMEGLGALVKICILSEFLQLE